MDNRIKNLAITLLASTAFLGNYATAQQVCKGKTWTPDNRYSISNDEVYDTETKLTWQRCLLGMKWDGSTCTGINIELDWPRARDLARKYASQGWRIPNIDELASLRSGSVNSDKGTGPTNSGCWNYALNETAFPEAGYAHVWSLSPNAQINRHIGYVYFRHGSISFDHRDVHKSIRLVKGNPYSGILIKSKMVIRAEDAMPW